VSSAHPGSPRRSADHRPGPSRITGHHPLVFPQLATAPRRPPLTSTPGRWATRRWADPSGLDPTAVSLTACPALAAAMGEASDVPPSCRPRLGPISQRSMKCAGSHSVPDPTALKGASEVGRKSGRSMTIGMGCASAPTTASSGELGTERTTSLARGRFPTAPLRSAGDDTETAMPSLRSGPPIANRGWRGRGSHSPLWPAKRPGALSPPGRY